MGGNSSPATSTNCGLKTSTLLALIRGLFVCSWIAPARKYIKTMHYIFIHIMYLAPQHENAVFFILILILILLVISPYLLLFT